MLRVGHHMQPGLRVPAHHPTPTHVPPPHTPSPQIMDYSLLLGIHHTNRGQQQQQQEVNNFKQVLGGATRATACAAAGQNTELGFV